MRRLLQLLRGRRHPREQDQAGHQDRERQAEDAIADEQQQRRRHRAGEECQRAGERQVAQEADGFVGAPCRVSSIFAEKLRDRSLRQRGLETGVKAEARPGALLEPPHQRHSASHSTAGELIENSIPAARTQSATTVSNTDRSAANVSWTISITAATANCWACETGARSARDVGQKQRLHPRLADPAAEGPAAPGQSRRRAKPKRGLISGVEPREHDIAGIIRASASPSRRRTAQRHHEALIDGHRVLDVDQTRDEVPERRRRSPGRQAEPA